MNLPNKPRVLAATYNPVSNTKMISFLVDFPTVLLAELRTHRIISDLDNEPLYAYNSKELNDFNLSANSARAIPANKYLQKVLDNPFVPIWTKQQKGMSGDMMLGEDKEFATTVWLESLKGVTFENYEDSEVIRQGIIDQYEALIKGIPPEYNTGVHKQNANRLLAPFAYTTCIISGTEWDNFFELRCPQYSMFYEQIPMSFKSRKEFIAFTNKVESDEFKIQDNTLSEQDWQEINKSSAQPEFQVIAEMLYDLYQEADWKESKYHIPFEEEIVEKYGNEIKLNKFQEREILFKNITGKTLKLDEDFNEIDYDWFETLMKISASMCAKLSYNTQDNEDTLEKHLERANGLIEHKHQEPFSHQAVAMNEKEYNEYFVNIRMIKETNNKGFKEPKLIQEKGKCYNLTGFISQRYILENY